MTECIINYRNKTVKYQEITISITHAFLVISVLLLGTLKQEDNENFDIIGGQ